MDISNSRVGSTSIEELSAACASTVHEFTSPFSWMTLLINGGITVGLFLTGFVSSLSLHQTSQVFNNITPDQSLHS